MSEYQYFEFQAIDRPLDRAAQEALRSISSRARITATSFTNHYEWGDLKGDPRKFMEQWFDLHLYVANWGTRRLMIRLPKRLLDRADIDPFLRQVDWVTVSSSGENVIIDIHRDEVEPDDDWDEGSSWLAALAPLRADMLSGDLRLFYLLWLTTVEEQLVADDEVEPLPGIGPLTGALQGFVDFFGIGPDLVRAAAERGAEIATTSKDGLREMLEVVPESEKTELLVRVVEGDTHVAAEMRSRLRRKHPASAAHRAVDAHEPYKKKRDGRCECGRRRSQRLVKARQPSGAKPNGASRLRKPKRRAALGSSLSRSAVRPCGARSRRKSNAAMHLATIGRQRCSPI